MSQFLCLWHPPRQPFDCLSHNHQRDLSKIDSRIVHQLWTSGQPPQNCFKFSPNTHHFTIAFVGRGYRAKPGPRSWWDISLWLLWLESFLVRRWLMLWQLRHLVSSIMYWNMLRRISWPWPIFSRMEMQQMSYNEQHLPYLTPIWSRHTHNHFHLLSDVNDDSVIHNLSANDPHVALPPGTVVHGPPHQPVSASSLVTYHLWYLFLTPVLLAAILIPNLK